MKVLNIPSANHSDLDSFFGIPEGWSVADAEAKAIQVQADLWAGSASPDLDQFREAMAAAGFIEIEWAQGPDWDEPPLKLGQKKRRR